MLVSCHHDAVLVYIIAAYCFGNNGLLLLLYIIALASLPGASTTLEVSLPFTAHTNVGLSQLMGLQAHEVTHLSQGPWLSLRPGLCTYIANI